MALLFNKATRDLSIKAEITLNNGQKVQLADNEIISYSFSASTGAEGLPLGTTEAASYTLVFDNVARKFKPYQMDNAEVRVFVGILEEAGYNYMDFGAWRVDEGTDPEQSVSMTLTGMDALANRFGAKFTDSEDVYPISVGELAETVCSLAGVALKNTAFYNADLKLEEMPAWKEGVTLRDIIGYCAICAAGFARIDRNGQLEIISYADGAQYDIGADLYQTLTETSGSAFSFNSIQAKLSEDEDEYTRFAVDPGVEDGPTTTIQIEYNPLLTEAIVNTIKDKLAGIVLTAAEISWGGDPEVRLGDMYTITNLRNEKVQMMVTSQAFTFDGGLSVNERCVLPSKNTTKSASYSTSTNVYNADGTLNATRISGLDRSVVKATVGHFEQLTAESIETDSLTTALLNAIDLRAQRIDTESIDTDKLTSIVARIVEATIQKLKAGTITTDELFSSYAEIFTLRANQVTAESISTDAFAAALANITVLVAGTANFERATVEHLVANLFNLTGSGVMEDVFIHNLQLVYAQIVSAQIGSLVLQSKEGDYYEISIVTGENGIPGVTATQVFPDDAEKAEGVYGTMKPIIATNITADNMSAATVKATQAIINHVVAARIDVDQLFAREAFITLLRTSKIVDEKSIELMVGDIEYATVHEGEEPPEGEIKEGKLWLDRGVTPPVLRRWKGLDVDSARSYEGVGTELYHETQQLVDDDALLSYDTITSRFPKPIKLDPPYSGKNLLDPFTIMSGYFMTYANGFVEDSRYRTVELYLPAGTYTISVSMQNLDGSAVYFLRYYIDGVRTNFETSLTRAYQTVTLDTAAKFTCVFRNTLTSDEFQSLRVQVEAGSTATEYEPYGLKGEIEGGLDDAELIYWSRNLFNGVVHNLAMTSDGFVSAGDGYRGIYVEVMPGGTYTVSRAKIEGNRFWVAASIERPEAGVSLEFLSNDNKVLTSTVTVPDGYYYLMVYLSNDNEEINPANYQIEEGETAHPIDPYVNEVLTAQFGDTTYGASYEWFSGELILPYAEVYAENATSYGTASTGMPYVRVPLEKTAVIDGTAVCDRYPVVTAAPTSDGVWIQENQALIYDARFSSLEVAREILNMEHPMLVYRLEVPETRSIEAPRPELKLTSYTFSGTGETLVVEYTGSGWETVNDTSEYAQAIPNLVTRNELDHIVRVKSDGLHIGAVGSTGEMHLQNDRMDLNVGGQTYSQFARDYVQFGQYKIGLAEDGGLFFKPM